MKIPLDIPRRRSFFGADTPPLKSTVMHRLPLESIAGTYLGGAFVPSPHTVRPSATATPATAKNNNAKTNFILRFMDNIVPFLAIRWQIPYYFTTIINPPPMASRTMFPCWETDTDFTHFGLSTRLIDLPVKS